MSSVAINGKSFLSVPNTKKTYQNQNPNPKGTKSQRSVSNELQQNAGERNEWKII